MPAQIRGDGKASNAGRAEASSLSSCAGLDHPQMFVGCLLQEKHNATTLNVKPCEMIVRPLLQSCADPSTGLLLPVLHSAQFLCAAAGCSIFIQHDLKESASKRSEPLTPNHLLLSTSKSSQPWTINQLILCYLCCPKGCISKPEMYGLEKLTTIHSAQAV